jgi:outer membrane protein assembly factor BamB
MKPTRVLVLILSACFVSAAWGQKPTCGTYTPWSEFHRPNMQRWNPCEKVLNVNNVRNLSLKWSYTAVGAFINSSPAVANGVVYFGSDDANVYALNASTGVKLWRRKIDPDSSPAVANGVVYLGSADNLYAFSLK